MRMDKVKTMGKLLAELLQHVPKKVTTEEDESANMFKRLTSLNLLVYAGTSDPVEFED